jgi:hypothetical protein
VTTKSIVDVLFMEPSTTTYPLRTPRIKFITKKAPMMTIEMK